MATSGSGNNNLLLFVTDRTSGQRYLVDSGAEVSVLPATRIDRQTLKPANGSAIPTFGKRTLSLHFGLRKNFNWTFILADVSQPIIGAYFFPWARIAHWPQAPPTVWLRSTLQKHSCLPFWPESTPPQLFFYGTIQSVLRHSPKLPPTHCFSNGWQDTDTWCPAPHCYCWKTNLRKGLSTFPCKAGCC